MSDPLDIFSPAYIGGVQLNNRILRAATHEGLAGENGAPTEQLIKLYERLSKGGVGAIITGFIGVSEESRSTDPGMSLLDSDDKIPAYAEMTDRVHQAGGVIIAQLAHCGALSKMGKAGRPDNLTSEQILKIEDEFVEAAKRAKAAGFDGIELHAAHGYLLSGMLSGSTNHRKKTIFLLLPAILLLLSGCSSGGQVMDGDGRVNSYTQISQEAAKAMMAQDDGHIIVDVRRQDEYDAGHIPGAILIPNESIGTEQPEELPDLDQIILIYCRSGNRSKQAAQKLFDMGYTNIYEFGGIIDWNGEIVTDEAPERSSQDSAAGEKTEKMLVRITAGERSITAELNDNDATKALWDQLPLTLPMMNLYGREMCHRMGKGALPDKDAADTGYEIGDISYWPPAGSLVILYKQNGEVFEQVKIGHTDDDVSFFDGMEDTDITFERIEQK